MIFTEQRSTHVISKVMESGIFPIFTQFENCDMHVDSSKGSFGFGVNLNRKRDQKLLQRVLEPSISEERIFLKEGGPAIN